MTVVVAANMTMSVKKNVAIAAVMMIPRRFDLISAVLSNLRIMRQSDTAHSFVGAKRLKGGNPLLLIRISPYATFRQYD